ncbi:alpha-amylase family glycosyl hydrolase [Nocardiopsis composta]|uniref:Maltose alpha-D-glucosyltransferase/alpha-amylase n=1 Tax=Nocardiopsis composta TaxID=157465 RepID=A0A7W8QLD0_9ACTN|nr:alpha-amylase family glycosyl hydrolase [Nocardiopsis composta]MBB5432425.1 maltose alpha-D-glucosyltransferase/alpha-amylase [Nocardiopsis composta]
MTPTAERNGVPDWFDDAVLYQVYPQSFADSDGDGIGDFAGITAHLDHLSWLGVDAVWINPCFASPFTDAGYDVADYFSVAPRYGTGEDLAHLVDEARRRGIRILFDLVAGHTSDRHPWFVHSASDPADDRYIWADRPAPGFRPSPGSREGYYKPNFFPSQPALNFGYAHPRENEPWRQPVDAEGPRANRRALAEIMDHWLRLGISGFRVDMAYSLVKDDPGQVETGRLWNELRAGLQAEHPEAVLVSEWGDPATAVGAGFHADFLLHFGGPWRGAALRSLWDTRSGTDRGHWDFRGSRCYFDAEGGGSPRTFLDAWRSASAAVEGRGRISLPTSNHDFSRLVCGPRTPEQARPAFAFLLTWPALPAIHYGDEIGMRYVPDLPDKEGSEIVPGVNRAGSRTPMQWDATPGAGFSTAAEDRFYLPLDPDPARPDVASQRADERSLLHLVRRLIALRKAHAGLGTGGAVEVVADGYPLVYERDGRYLVAVNPRRDAAEVAVAGYGGARPLLTEGAECTASGIRVRGFGFGVFEL